MAHGKGPRNGQNPAKDRGLDGQGSQGHLVPATGPGDWDALEGVIGRLIKDGHKPVRAYVTFDPHADHLPHVGCGVQVRRGAYFAIRLSDGRWLNDQSHDWD